MKIEGYWYSENSPQYPMPLPNVLTKEEAEEVYELIKAKENESRCIGTKGMSISRIDNETIVGSEEFRHKSGWIWPAGFAEHYIRDNRVKPSDDFLRFIGYLNTKNGFREAFEFMENMRKFEERSDKVSIRVGNPTK